MKRFIALLFICSLASTSCSKNSSATDDDSTGGGGTTFTGAQIAKAWTSNCTAFSDSTVGTSYIKNELTLNSDNSFSFIQYMHTASDCNNASYRAVLIVYGAYSVGSVVSGSTQAIVFSVTTTGGLAPDMMIIDDSGHTALTTIETNWNTDCGGTSPYCTLVSSSCTLNTVASGAHSATKNMTCTSHTFPNTGNNTIYNIATYDGSTLTMGAGVTGVPGVFSAGALPGAVSVVYH